MAAAVAAAAAAAGEEGGMGSPFHLPPAVSATPAMNESQHSQADTDHKSAKRRADEAVVKAAGKFLQRSLSGSQAQGGSGNKGGKARKEKEGSGEKGGDDGGSNKKKGKEESPGGQGGGLVRCEAGASAKQSNVAADVTGSDIPPGDGVFPLSVATPGVSPGGAMQADEKPIKGQKGNTEGGQIGRKVRGKDEGRRGNGGRGGRQGLGKDKGSAEMGEGEGKVKEEGKAVGELGGLEVNGMKAEHTAQISTGEGGNKPAGKSSGARNRGGSGKAADGSGTAGVKAPASVKGSRGGKSAAAAAAAAAAAGSGGSAIAAGAGPPPRPAMTDQETEVAEALFDLANLFNPSPDSPAPPPAAGADEDAGAGDGDTNARETGERGGEGREEKDSVVLNTSPGGGAPAGKREAGKGQGRRRGGKTQGKDVEGGERADGDTPARKGGRGGGGEKGEGSRKRRVVDGDKSEGRNGERPIIRKTHCLRRSSPVLILNPLLRASRSSQAVDTTCLDSSLFLELSSCITHVVSLSILFITFSLPSRLSPPPLPPIPPPTLCTTRNIPTLPTLLPSSRQASSHHISSPNRKLPIPCSSSPGLRKPCPCLAGTFLHSS